MEQGVAPFFMPLRFVTINNICIMKKSIVYTKTGDQGTTGLIGGTRVPKNHIRLEAYGTTDELNSQLGLLVTYLTEKSDRDFIIKVQNKLFSLGAYLATDQEKAQITDISNITPNDITDVEREIDRIDETLPALHAFAIPGGSRGAAICHVCRTVCRRTERCVLTLAESYFVSSDLLIYLNRLSDYLFMLSRKINIIEKRDEIFWNTNSM
ncbi:Cob(I)yrinic acid a c-diamide adenosyltransferase [termite gut metagenome]|uniref:Cob(I)yrinic acid a c-diamide adenosyltransferase n=2 Tax=termite gut metagenome TaxID=433724 RepID=A0A5J4Q9U7_9ZZZZ